MASRHKTKSHRVDNKIFRRTAGRTKKININPSIMRGGIRL